MPQKGVSYQNRFLSHKICHITLSCPSEGRQHEDNPPVLVQSGGACTWTCFTALVEPTLPATACQQQRGPGPILPRKSQHGPIMEIKPNECLAFGIPWAPPHNHQDTLLAWLASKIRIADFQEISTHLAGAQGLRDWN